ncbi:MAG: fibro-slime domain-containing protein, partial [Rhodospirillales bacterium]|nr:fibro-slime domain-containing protein [Rhodospirillales bacterium]
VLDNDSDEPGGVYSFAVEKPEYFFPIDGMGWNDTALDKNGDERNFYFTYEIHTEFTYIDPAERDYDMVFSFTGDDDVWVFINGRLAVDIGGVHGQARDAVNLDDEAEALGLEPGEAYSLDFFFAERHTTESNFRIETTIQLEEVAPTTVSPLYD